MRLVPFLDGEAVRHQRLQNSGAVARCRARTVMALAERHYTHIIPLDMSEFEKMDGGLSCLSLRY